MRAVTPLTEGGADEDPPESAAPSDRKFEFKPLFPKSAPSTTKAAEKVNVKVVDDSSAR